MTRPRRPPGRAALLCRRDAQHQQEMVCGECQQIAPLDTGLVARRQLRITQFADRLDLASTEHPLQDIQAFFRERGR